MTRSFAIASLPLNLKKVVKYYLTILILLFAFSVSAQDSAFDREWKNIPPAFTGNNFEDIFNILMQTSVFEEKYDSKTNDRYNRRTNDLSRISFGNSLNIKSSLVFVSYPQTASVEYDAKSGLLSLNLETSSINLKSSNNRALQNLLTVEVQKSEVKDEGEQAIQGRFDAIIIKKRAFYFYNLAIKNIDKFNESITAKSSGLNFKIKISKEKAQELKENLGVLYIAKLSAPYFKLDTVTLQPTLLTKTEIISNEQFLIANVSDIWIFNKATGEIISKSSAR